MTNDVACRSHPRRDKAKGERDIVGSIPRSPELTNDALIERLNIPTRIRNALINARFKTVVEVRESSDTLFNFQRIGKTTAAEALGPSRDCPARRARERSCDEPPALASTDSSAVWLADLIETSEAGAASEERCDPATVKAFSDRLAMPAVTGHCSISCAPDRPAGLTGVSKVVHSESIR